VGAGALLWGVDGIEEVGLRSGVVASTGVAVLEGSRLVTGVISVPISLIQTDLTTGTTASSYHQIIKRNNSR
jgi:hypothetical protein